MANPNQASVTAIKAAAQKYGLDPAAMVAVARVESGLNPRAIGDSGHAFGLFQFNNAGGVATGDPNPQKYLDPNYNAMEAARHIASIKGARGAKGAAAVRLIVNQFERPANKQGEISKALSFLGKDAVTAPSLMSKGSVTASNAALSSGQGNTQSNTSSVLGALLSSAMTGSVPAHAGEADPSGTLLPLLLQASQQGEPSPAPTLTPQATTTQPSGVGTGAVTTLKNPRIIGTPYKGTHTLGNWESDDAIDIAMPVGTPLYAVADGTIGSQIGAIAGSGSGRFAGQRLHLKTSGNELYYAHLSKLAVKAGQQVKKGQLLGYSGEANGVAHLHLGSKNGDPQKYA